MDAVRKALCIHRTRISLREIRNKWKGHTWTENDEDASELRGVEDGLQGPPVFKVEDAGCGVGQAPYRSVMLPYLRRYIQLHTMDVNAEYSSARVVLIERVQHVPDAVEAGSDHLLEDVEP